MMGTGSEKGLVDEGGRGDRAQNGGTTVVDGEIPVSAKRRHSNIKDAIVFVLKLPPLSICKMSSATFRISLIGQFSVDETCKGGRGADAALTDHFPTEME